MSNVVIIGLVFFYLLARLEQHLANVQHGLELQLKDKEVQRLTDLLAARSAAEFVTIRKDGHSAAVKQTEKRPRIPADAITNV